MPLFKLENADAGFIDLTRVFVYKGQSTTKTQPNSVAVDAIVRVRPCNRLDGQRATVELNNGSSVETTETYSEIMEMIEDRLEA